MDKIKKEVPQSIIDSIESNYKYAQITVKPLFSYYGGVFELTYKNSDQCILKIIRNPDEYKLAHLNTEIEFCDFVKNNITEFKTQTFIPDIDGKLIQRIDGDIYYLLEKHEIIKKDKLDKNEQRLVGKLMKIFHTKLASFRQGGMGDSAWMREVSDMEYELLLKNFKENDFAKYVTPLDYEELKIERTLIHGDWHGENMSFTDPPFLFDLDTLCRGSAVEEIARALTHFDTGVPVKDFFDNLIIGYGDLRRDEIDLIPHVAVAICYKSFAELTQHGDKKYANSFIELAGEMKKIFNLT